MTAMAGNRWSSRQESETSFCAKSWQERQQSSGSPVTKSAMNNYHGSMHSVHYIRDATFITEI